LLGLSGFPSGADASIAGLPGLMTVHHTGGLFTSWTHNCPTPHPDERPSAVEQVVFESLLDRARARLQVSTEIGRDGIRQRRIMDALAPLFPDLPVGRMVQPMPIAATTVAGGVRYTGPSDVLAAERYTGRLQLLTKCVGRRVEWFGDRATGIIAARRGEEIRISADNVVVAAGTAHSAQLLYASNVRPEALGRYLVDHPLIQANVNLQRRIAEELPDDDPPFTVWIPYSDRHPFQVIVLRGPLVFLPPGGQDSRAVATVAAICAQDSSPDNRLVFDDERLDPFGLPAMTARFALSAADRRRVGEALRETHAICSEFGDLAPGRQPYLWAQGASFHLLGSCRRDRTDDGISVTNAQGRVWGFSNRSAQTLVDKVSTNRRQSQVTFVLSGVRGRCGSASCQGNGAEVRERGCHCRFRCDGYGAGQPAGEHEPARLQGGLLLGEGVRRECQGLGWVSVGGHAGRGVEDSAVDL
jgi:hypothetical protein